MSGMLCLAKLNVEAEQQVPERDPMPKDRRRESDPAPFADPAETRDRR